MIKYCYPNLPNFINPETVDDYKPFYIAENKKNGWRCLAWRKDEGLELWTRRHTIIPDKLPITRELLSNLPIGTIIDGELLDKRTKTLKDHYYAFDILFLKGESVMHKAWEQRRAILESVLNANKVFVELSRPIQLGFSTLYKNALAEGDEGIVIKHIHSKYLVGLKNCPHNPQWFKAKRAEACFVKEERNGNL